MAAKRRAAQSGSLGVPCGRRLLGSELPEASCGRVVPNAWAMGWSVRAITMSTPLNHFATLMKIAHVVDVLNN